MITYATQFIERSEDVNIVERFSFYLEQEGVPPHRYQAKINLYPYNQKNAILFVEIYRKDGVFDESYHFQ